MTLLFAQELFEVYLSGGSFREGYELFQDLSMDSWMVWQGISFSKDRQKIFLQKGGWFLLIWKLCQK